jgi:DNA polymerase IV
MILHVDMDAFYAAVEEREDPALVGQCVIVGGSAEGRGVVAAANYEARKFGVHSAMSAARARKLCPQAVFLRPRMDLYAAVSRQIRGILERFTPLVEPLSLDEAFLDVAGSLPLFGPAAQIGRRIKESIRAETRLVASVGVAPNKFVAKIASDLEKPDGFVVVDQAGIREFLDPLPVGRIWGVGKVTGRVFAKLGVRTIGELRRLSEPLLRETFGSTSEHYRRLANGIDERRVVPDRSARSISHETTFSRDIRDRELLRSCLAELVEQVGRRLRRHGRRCRTIELKIRFADFRTVTRSATLPEATDVTQELLRGAVQLLTDNLPARPAPIRLLGFGVHGLEEAIVQPTLFEEIDRDKQRTLDRVADRIAERFGKSALRRAIGLDDPPP